jgi:hypothetical protein
MVIAQKPLSIPVLVAHRWMLAARQAQTNVGVDRSRLRLQLSINSTPST